MVLFHTAIPSSVHPTMEEKWKEAILGALLSLDSRHFSILIPSLASDFLLHHQRLLSLLTSPLLFSQTLQYIESLSLHHKTLLLARLLLRSLHKLTQFFHKTTLNSVTTGFINRRDFDAGLLLLALCEVSELDHRDWHARVMDHMLTSVLNLSGLGASGWAILGPYIDTAIKCRRFLMAVTGGNSGSAKAAASTAVIVSLPLVECDGVCKDCVICKEGLKGEKDACELPCGHVFHWLCVFPWLRKVNTCPYCRFELPTDDVLCEIERIWRVVVERSRQDFCGDYYCC